MKKRVKKVSLCSETLRNLDAPQLRDVAAGLTALCTLRLPACTATNVCSGCRPCD